MNIYGLSISAGRVFRFASLKDMWYRTFALNKLGLGLREYENASKGGAKIVPDVENLLTNYRTHQQILNFSHQLVRILTHFWPRRIDKLPRETSSLSGERPLLVYNISAENFGRLMLETHWGGADKAKAAVAVKEEEDDHDAASVNKVGMTTTTTLRR